MTELLSKEFSRKSFVKGGGALVVGFSMAGAALAAALALREGRLFGVHLNDGYGQADDGLLVGSVHPWQTLELLATLSRYDYRGTIYFDTFPVREDPAAESAANVARVRALEAILDRLDTERLTELQARHDAIGVQALLHEVTFGWDGH